MAAVWSQARTLTRRATDIPTRWLVLVGLTVASTAVFLWACQWNLSIGETASDTGGDGRNDGA